MTRSLADRLLPVNGTPVDRRNQRRYVVLLLLFGAAWSVLRLLIARGTIPMGLPAAGAASLIGGLGLAVVWAYLRFYHETDELQRRIQLEGLAYGFAVGIIWIVFVALLRLAGADGPEVVSPAMFMASAYGIGVFLAATRYGVEP